MLDLRGELVDSPKRKSKKSKIIIGIGAIALITGLGNTLAASISLNAGDPVEFGQGVAQTAACDDDGITFTPASEYSTTSNQFNLSQISISGINFSTTDSEGVGCAGKTFILKAFTDVTVGSDYSASAVGADSANPLYLTFADSSKYNSQIAITIAADGNSISHLYVAAEDSNTAQIASSDFDSTVDTAGTFNIDLTSGVDSRAVNKFTIESIDTPTDGLDSGSWTEVTIV